MLKLLFSFLLVSVSVSQNNFNENGEKIGAWSGYHDNGKMKYHGEFFNGKEVGVFKYYDYYGNMVVKLNYVDTGLTSEATLYYPSGGVQLEGQYVNKKKSGIWLYYNKFGIIKSKENYLEGVLDGTAIYYYDNGLISEKYMYSNGVKSGLGEVFYNSGVLNMRASYQDGKIHGSAEFYYNTKLIKLESKGIYNMGVKDSVWLFFTQLGDTLKLIEYHMGDVLRNE